MKLAPAEWLFIVALLLFAAGLRIIGLTYGQPDPRYDHSGLDRGLINVNTPIHPDEFLFITRPLQMLLTRQYNPKFFHNPSFLNNLNFVTFWLTGADNGLWHEDREGVNGRSYAPFYLYVIGRTYSALGGLLAVAATYAVTRRIAGRFAAAGTGLLVTVSLPMVQHAHYTTTSSLAAGFTAVAVWAGVVSLHDRRRSLFALAGIAAGLAAGNRYNAAAVGIVVFVVGLILLYREPTRRMLRGVLIGWLLIPAMFTFTTPWVIFDPTFFLSEFRYITGQYLSGLDVQFTTPYGLLFEYRYLILFSIGIPAALATLLGIYAAWTNRPRRDLFKVNSQQLVVLILAAYLIPYSLVNLQTVRPGLSDQMLVPVIPQFAIAAGLGLAWIYEHIRLSKRLLVPALILALVVIPIIPTVQLTRQFSLPDTRQSMQQWIYEHLPLGSHIHLYGAYNVPLDAADYPWTQNFAAQLVTIPQILGQQPFDGPEIVYRMEDSRDLVPMEELQPAEVDYIILSDAWYYNTERSWEIVPAAYIRQIRETLASFGQSLTEVARINRPVWFGSDSIMHTASYWHNPGLIVYCVDEASCAAVR